jgi:hypothetical protein
MTQPQILAVFADAAADPRFPIALGIAALAGLVRGFTGFGSALIYMPLVSAVYSPQIAAATLLLIDSISSLPVSIRAIPQCNWREVTPVTIAGAVAVSRQADDRSFGRGSARSPGSAPAPRKSARLRC